MYKKDVQNALNALRDTLVAYRANPFRIDLPRPAGVIKVGADDFIVANGKNAKRAFSNLERISLFLPDGISGDLLLKKEIRAAAWIIPNLIPVGLSFFAGKPKVGKSWFVLELVVAIVTGNCALGYYDLNENKEVEVLYLALEDSARRMQDRLKKIASHFITNNEAAKRAHFHFSWHSVEEKGLIALESWLSKNPKCKIVFIDTFAKVRRRPKNNNSYYEDYEAASALKQIADRFEIAVFVVHHVRKQESNDPFDMISGTNGISGSADTNFVLIRDRNKDEGVLHISGRDISEQELAVSFDNGVWKVLGNAAPLKMSKAHNEILLALIEAGKPLSLTELAQESGRAVQGFKKTADRMVRDGIMIRNKDMKYEPVPTKLPKFTKTHKEE